MPGIASPRLVCDEPDGAGPHFVHNELRVAGWALGAERVTVSLGAVTADANVGLTSPDVRDEFPDVRGSDRARFEVALPTAGCAPGMQPVSVVAVPADGRELRVERVVVLHPYEQPGASTAESVRAGLTALEFDPPSHWETGDPRAPLQITGWSYSEAGIDRVIVFFDDRAQYEALFPCVRPDVRAHLAIRDALLSGFALPIEREDCPDGEHELTIVAVTRDGRSAGRTVTFTSGTVPRVEPAPEPDSDEPAGAEPPHEAPAPGARARALERRARYRWAASLAHGRSVLDVGCGRGEGTAILALAGPKRLVGVDSSGAALGLARATPPPGTEFVLGDAGELPFAAAEFDLVVCLEPGDVGDPALDEFRRVLRPGGICVLAASPPTEPWRRSEQTGDQLVAALSARFTHVQVARQHTYLASAVGRVEACALADESAPGPPSASIAIASDASLPELAGAAEAAAADDMLEQIALLELRETVAERNALASLIELNTVSFVYQSLLRTLHDTRTELKGAERARHDADARAATAEQGRLDAQHWLDAQQRSLSWRITWPLRAAKRAASERLLARSRR
ncbi:MAG TPA: class I SAM-dependent methyltransferase [Solirubrobacteraceae bacterium]|nr:class I SAM-dependent methyltransferase [Solirubrobacteraceae bacterium]